MKIEGFEDIEVWQIARELTREVYSISGKGDFAKDFKLRDQIRDAAGSSMHNIAEGFDSGGNREFIRFLRYFYRSCSEIRSQLYVAIDQKYITAEEFQWIYDLSGKTKDKVGGFIKYLRHYDSDS